MEHPPDSNRHVRRWPTLLLGASLALIAVALLMVAHHHESKIVLGAILAALLVGWVPAAAFGRLTYSWSAADSRGPVERAVISGSAIGGGLLCGNLLSPEPWGIRLPSVMLAAFLVAGLVVLVADWLTRRRPERAEHRA
ncbi:hypothetical protein [Kineococcus sp. NPDC059986]|uniref:hypothetical protein n=1 Tax=Kineococcus sp. NPDC059986 TaxID=3155538 RepID=UPI00345007A7